MPINLNNPKQFTLAGIRQLIASYDDSRDRQLRVDVNGIADIYNEDGPENMEGMYLRTETFDAGSGYLGREAARDDDWVKRIYEALKRNWPNRKESPMLLD